ncbi:MAG: tRNA (guanosine(37)-N1)-methyltransferase TrmD [Actinomycetota bacterium]
MRIDVVTIFPDALRPFFAAALLGKAGARGLVDVRVHDLREHSTNRHRKVDDEPFGGGPGMVMTAEPFFRAVGAIAPDRKPDDPRVVLLSPQGRRLTQSIVGELAAVPWIVLLCGRYEGVDERVATELVDEELSIGDYVLAGGEAAAAAVVDAVARLVPGVVGEPDSVEGESFEDGRLDHPHYTRPADFQGHEVPPVLLSGDHAAIVRWRREQAERRTRERRPDLLADEP